MIFSDFWPIFGGLSSYLDKFGEIWWPPPRQQCPAVGQALIGIIMGPNSHHSWHYPSHHVQQDSVIPATFIRACLEWEKCQKVMFPESWHLSADTSYTQKCKFPRVWLRGTAASDEVGERQRASVLHPKVEIFKISLSPSICTKHLCYCYLYDDLLSRFKWVHWAWVGEMEYILYIICIYRVI